MTPLLIVVTALIATLLTSYLHYRFWVRRYTVELEYTVETKVNTEDGSRVELRRLPSVDAPRGSDPQTELPPVLMVHGLAFNHRNNDLTEELSIARHLAREGRDVWLLTLRSGRHDLTFVERRTTTFDAMARHDVPTGVREVLERTGSTELDYLGFSMGGMLLYASAGRFVPEEQLRRVVIVGSPATITAPAAMLTVLAGFVPEWVVPTVPLRILSRMVAFAADWMHTPVHHMIINPANVAPGVAAQALVNGFANIPSPLAGQFVRWARKHEVAGVGDTPLTATVAKLRTPVLFVAGTADLLAPPEAVRVAYDAWGTEVSGEVNKRFELKGIDHGAAADYGHGDLVFGRFAREDVFEPVSEFLSSPLS